MGKCGNSEWFRTWFDSRYYHMLYRHRDENEASEFIDRLLSYIHLKPGSRVLDLACGKGRHSIFLHSRGFQVTGIDLSGESIRMAKVHEAPGLEFGVQDMRDFHFDEKFDCIVNLFTSFGYFRDPADNLKVIDRVKQHLQPGGYFILDYLNANELCGKQWPEQVHECSGVRFTIRKAIRDQRIIKEIHVVEGEESFDFEEDVMLLRSDDIRTMLQTCGLKILAEFGDYQLGAYDPDKSSRFIIIAAN